jgi:hypothetical protein
MVPLDRISVHWILEHISGVILGDLVDDIEKEGQWLALVHFSLSEAPRGGL